MLPFLFSSSLADLIPVRHQEGVSLGFLVLRNEAGEPIAYGDVQQVAEKDHVMADMKFKFNDGSYYEEVTKFTQHGFFRLLSDEVLQRGPSFKQQMKSWIDATTGNVTVRSTEKGKEKIVTKHLELPPDVANASAKMTSVSMVAVSTSPRIVKLNFSPQPQGIFHVGPIPYKAQRYQVKIEIGGIKGKIAPLVGKRPANLHPQEGSPRDQKK